MTPKERPIIFSGDMVNAILEGRKTMTRRIVKPGRGQSWLSQDAINRSPRAYITDIDGDTWAQFAHPLAGKVRHGIYEPEWSPMTCIKCPYGQPGDRLYVKETWQHSNSPDGPYDEDCHVFYRADFLDDPEGPDMEKRSDWRRRTWKPSVHMPRSASRILLEITDVRVERLQDTADEDVKRFISVWDRTPWVWAIEFKRIEL